MRVSAGFLGRRPSLSRATCGSFESSLPLPFEEFMPNCVRLRCSLAKWRFGYSAVALSLGLSIACFSGSAQGQTYQVIHNFTGGADGASPLAALTPTRAGNFYGTTNAGGQGWGGVFELSSLGTIWNLVPLHTFTAIPANSNDTGNGGVRSDSPVVIGSDGDLYGVTEAGGNPLWSCGTVFKMSGGADPPAGHWTYNVIYQFGGDPDGCGPSGPVIFDRAGNIYGTTLHGGRVSLHRRNGI